MEIYEALVELCMFFAKKELMLETLQDHNHLWGCENRLANKIPPQ